MNKLIEVKDLKKSYGEVKAVKGIDFYVETGSLFAFLGPNGAGKSTTIEMMCTLLQPDSGEIKIAGYKIGEEDDKIRDIIGIVFQDGVLDQALTVRENLLIRGEFYHMKRRQLKEAVENAARTVEISELLDRPYGKLSGGQRRRADIARALIHTPKVLFLDEPTTGLDPQTRQQVWQTVKVLQEKTGMTVFLTTHYMEEAAVADYITIMKEGNIVAKGTPVELKQEYASDLLKIKPQQRKELEEKLQQMKRSYEKKGEVFAIRVKDTLEALALATELKELIANIEIVNGTMDEVFIRIIGKEKEDVHTSKKKYKASF